MFHDDASPLPPARRVSCHMLHTGRRLAVAAAATFTLTAAGGGVAVAANASLGSSAVGAPAAASAVLAPRTPLPKPPQAPARPAWEHRLTVKFHDAIEARPSALDPARPVVSRTGADLVEIHRLALAHDARFEPLIRLPQSRLNFMQDRAAQASGIAQPDLAGMMIVTLADPERSLQAMADALHASPLVEWVWFEQMYPDPPSCEDALPVTPPYFPSLQGYHGADPGLNMQAAWTLGSARGAGITLADCEYGYVLGHEDLCGVILEPGQTIHPTVVSYGWDEHGTAVLGEIVGSDNDYGVTGLAPDAEALFFTEWSVEEGYRRVTAITNAIATLEAGDVVLLEMQAGGPDGRYCPAEIDPAVWTVVKAGSDSGIIVVGAAGNGAANLDGSAYAEYRSRGDSGAIIVGAGSSNTGHNALSFSTYGSRVNVQGWGENVFTLGYGDYAQHGGDKNQRYTSRFSGTSSASPFVAGSAVALQSLAVEQLGRRLGPMEMRDLLIDTGLPQGSGGNIGPFPDVYAAGLALIASADRLDLQTPTLQAGEVATLVVTNATPQAVVAFVYSLTGTGSTYVPQLDVTLGLDQPTLIGTAVAGTAGEARLDRTVPRAAANRPIWLQAAEPGRVSNVEATVVGP